MDETQTNQPTLGTWDKLPTEEQERKPKISFEINKEVEVMFASDNPQEYQGDNGAYYIFDVKEYDKQTRSMEDKVIMTSAWSLLRELKKLVPLKDKRVKITKVMEKGKQYFKVTPEPIEQEVK